MRPLYRVIKEYNAQFDYAFIAEKGERITLGKIDEETNKWYWCKHATGLEAWVPVTHIEIEGDTAVFTHPYNSVEHSIKKGEIVQFLGETYGWIECLNSEWRYGWIPTSNLEKI